MYITQSRKYMQNKFYYKLKMNNYETLKHIFTKYLKLTFYRRHDIIFKIF